MADQSKPVWADHGWGQDDSSDYPRCSACGMDLSRIPGGDWMETSALCRISYALMRLAEPKRLVKPAKEW